MVLLCSVSGFSQTTFTVDNIKYEVTDSVLNTVSATGRNGNLPDELIIPETVNHDSVEYEVTNIGKEAFKGETLEHVVIPNTVSVIEDSAFESTGLKNVSFSEGLITIGSSAFKDNILKAITLPSSLTTIKLDAFKSNRLRTVIAKGTNPPSCLLGNSGNCFDLLYSCILYVPKGTSRAYVLAGWNSFGIQEGVVADIQVYLEGASLNPNEGEDKYMRDDLRKMGLLPTESPYADGVTIKDITVLTTSGKSAIVDWVFVELRDGNDNTTVLSGVSALLQRDGDIVAIDGVSKLEFEGIEPGSYYIAVYHRNHLGIMSAHPITLPNTIELTSSFYWMFVNVPINFTVDPTTNIMGGENALIKVRDGVYALIGGDYDSNDQIQNTDKGSVVPIIGVSGYNRGDLDMNGQVQNTDILNIMNKNIGRGVQFNK
jgi:hypothetical protein